jgi:formate dehydrogenase subunit gamma
MRPSRDEILALVGPLKDRPGPLLEMLHALQDRLGYVPADAIPVLAETLNLSRAEVHGVVSFYHHFRDRPPARRRIDVCRAESCLALHGDALLGHIEQSTGVRLGETSADGSVEVQPVYCLGLCAASPALMIDGEVQGRVTPDRFDALLARPEPVK